MDSDEARDLYNKVMEIGCCKRCALRYLGVSKFFLNFEDPDTNLITFGCISPMDQIREMSQNKRKKENPCIVCLGLLQESIFKEMLAHEDLMKIEKINCETFQVHITFPMCMLIRDHSVKVYLKKSFPSFNSSGVIKLNHAWRYCIENRLSKAISKTFSSLAPLALHFSTSYLLDKEEVEVLQSFIDQRHEGTLSRHSILSLLETILDEDFEKLVRVPSRIPFYNVTLTDVKYYAENIYLMGSYCKYSRNLLLFNKVVIDEPSIEAAVINSVKSVVSEFDKISFKTSGFDELDVRVLGKGRTFSISIENPKCVSLSREECRKIEKLINVSKEFKVKNFRHADKRDIQVIMDSEMVAQRSLKLLCLVYEGKNINRCVNAVNMYKTVNVQQKTPIIHLAKRPVQIKDRKIYYMRATKAADNLIELDLCVESGLYIPAFITGDFGRTKPSLREIMNAKVDLLALDILDLYPTVPEDMEEDVSI